MYKENQKQNTVKHACYDHPWDTKIVAVVDRWSLFTGHLCNKIFKWDLKMMVVVDKGSLFGGGRKFRFYCIKFLLFFKRKRMEFSWRKCWSNWISLPSQDIFHRKNLAKVAVSSISGEGTLIFSDTSLDWPVLYCWKICDLEAK